MTEVEQIREKMEVRALTWRTLAARANVDHREVSQWCLHAAPVSHATRLAVLSELGLLEKPQPVTELRRQRIKPSRIPGQRKEPEPMVSITPEELAELLARGKAAGLTLYTIGYLCGFKTREYKELLAGKLVKPYRKQKILGTQFAMMAKRSGPIRTEQLP